MYRIWLAAFLLAIPLVSSAFAESGPDYDLNEVLPGKFQFIAHFDRVQDSDGSWKNYLFSETSEKITIKSATAILEYNKANCSYTIKDDANNTLIPYITWTGKRAISGTNNWESMTVNAEQCQTTVNQESEKITIVSTKQNESQKVENEIIISYKIKETIRISDQSITELTFENGTKINVPKYKLGAVQTVFGPELIINGQTLNLSNLAGQFYDRNWIEQNQAKIFQITDGLNYDFDVGFQSLWGIKIYADKIALDYNNAPNAVNVLEIDPSYTNTYTSTTVTDWTVPSDVTSATVKAWGAGGGGSISGKGDGGGGGFAQGTITVSSGQTYKVVVGGGGGKAGSGAGGAGGANGGGAGAYGGVISDYTSGGGGGYSGVFLTSVSQANAKIIAGGGGGGGRDGATSDAGAGGGTNGEDGTSGSLNVYGKKGTQTAGGAGGSGYAGGYNGGAGSALLGGSAVAHIDGYYTGGGGGGGYYGGGAGGNIGSSSPPSTNNGGAGGSGYVTGTSTTLTAGSGSSVANSSDSDYASSKGNGGTPTNNGQNGYVVISYSVVTTANAPTALSATAGNTQASLSWTAPNDNGGASITDYVVQYSTDNSNWSTFADGTSTATTATVTGLTKNTLYYFRVAAVNSAGTGTYSTSASTTVLGVPNAPTSLSASSSAASQASLSWTAPTNNGGASITDYVIQYSTDNSNWSTFADGTSTATSATVTGLSQNTLYYFRVAATNSQGNSSYSSSASVTVWATPPGTPTGVTSSGPTTSQISLSWTQPASNGSTITDYVIQYSTDNSSWSTFADGTSASLSATVTGLSSNTLYYFRVAAVNGIGTGSYSSSATGTTIANAPTALSASAASSTSINLSWTAPSGSATSDYTIQYSTDNTTWNTISHSASTSTSYTVTGLSTNTLYYFRVAAVNAGGTSTFTSSASSPTLPGAPSGLASLVMSSTQINLSWYAPTGSASITDYVIQYSSNGGTSWTTFSDGTSNSPNAFVTGLTSNTSYLFRVAGVNSAGTGVYSSNLSATTHTSGTISVTVNHSTIGATSRLTYSASYSGTPAITSFNFEVKEGATTLRNADTNSTYYYHAANDTPHTITVTATPVTSHWQNPSGSDTETVTASYNPSWSGAGTAYNQSRTTSTISLLVNRDLDHTWNLSCNFKTAAQAASNSAGTWKNQSNIWAYSDSLTISNTTSAYIVCYDGTDIILNLVGFGTERILGGISLLNDTFDSWLGVPVGMIFILFVAGMFGGRTAPTGILLILAMVGIMGFIGLLAISTTIWAFVLLAGTLGIFIGKRFL